MKTTNSRVTNKMLQAKIETLIKGNNSPKSQEVIKTSRIKNLYRQSSAFYLWLITGVLGYSNKIPIVRNIISILSIWYGRTTWWSILVKVRKAFVTFNAIIGMYMVYKTTGFGFDNFLASFVAIGETYVDIFVNFNKRIFNWLYNLFNSKVVPNVPNNPPSSLNPTTWFNGTNNIPPKSNWLTNTNNSIGPTGWSNRGISFDDSNSIRKLYTDNPVNININTSPWYKDLTTWLLLGGSLACVGVLYLGVKIIMDPLMINDLPIIGSLFKSNVPVTSPDGSITPTYIGDPGSSKSFTQGVITLIGSGINKFNPLNWFPSSSETRVQATAFSIVQTTHQADTAFYPFTEVNPYDSWLKRLRISWLGETAYEQSVRFRERASAWHKIIPYPPVGNHTPLLPSVATTPTIGTIGLGLNTLGLDNSFNYVSSRLSSLSNTPTNLPVSLPTILPEFEGGVTSWVGHTIKPSDVIEYYSKKATPSTFAEIAKRSFPEIGKAPLKTSNKFAVLDQINID